VKQGAQQRRVAHGRQPGSVDPDLRPRFPSCQDGPVAARRRQGGRCAELAAAGAPRRATYSESRPC